jgi:hypothetical protein
MQVFNCEREEFEIRTPVLIVQMVEINSWERLVPAEKSTH